MIQEYSKSLGLLALGVDPLATEMVESDVEQCNHYQRPHIHVNVNGNVEVERRKTTPSHQQ